MLALVTGASRGIGRAIVLEFARNGFDVAINYNRSSESAQKICDEAVALGVKAGIFQADVGDSEQVKELFSKVKASLGAVNVLVNNAGITRDNLLMRMKPVKKKCFQFFKRYSELIICLLFVMCTRK